MIMSGLFNTKVCSENWTFDYLKLSIEDKKPPITNVMIHNGFNLETYGYNYIMNWMNIVIQKPHAGLIQHK